MRRLSALVAPATLFLALAACGDGAETDPAGEGRSAAGEILEGSISDEMLPYDRLRSRPPLASPEEVEGNEPADTAPAEAPPAAD